LTDRPRVPERSGRRCENEQLVGRVGEQRELLAADRACLHVRERAGTFLAVENVERELATS
jgi:hypothetical protein